MDLSIDSKAEDDVEVDSEDEVKSAPSIWRGRPLHQIVLRSQATDQVPMQIIKVVPRKVLKRDPTPMTLRNHDKERDVKQEVSVQMPKKKPKYLMPEQVEIKKQQTTSTSGVLIFNSPPGGSLSASGAYSNVNLTKGSLLTSNGTLPVKMLPGSDGTVLTADSTFPNGLKWASGASGGMVVTFQPGGTAVSGSVFTDFASLCTYINAQSLIGTWTIQVDATMAPIVGQAQIAAGTYVLPSSVRFTGMPNPSSNTNYPALQGARVQFNPVPKFIYFENFSNVDLTNFGSAAFIAAPLGETNLYIKFANLLPASTMFDFSASNAILNVVGHSAIVGNGSAEAIDFGITTTSNIALYDSSVLNLGALSTNASSLVIITYDTTTTINFAYWSTSGYLVEFKGPQNGTIDLANGISPVIDAYLTAKSRIVATISNKNSSTAVGIPSTTNRVVNAGLGSFQIESLNPTNGTRQTNDNSSVDWVVINTSPLT